MTANLTFYLEENLRIIEREDKDTLFLGHLKLPNKELKVGIDKQKLKSDLIRVTKKSAGFVESMLKRNASAYFFDFVEYDFGKVYPSITRMIEGEFGDVESFVKLKSPDLLAPQGETLTHRGSDTMDLFGAHNTAVVVDPPPLNEGKDEVYITDPDMVTSAPAGKTVAPPSQAELARVELVAPAPTKVIKPADVSPGVKKAMAEKLGKPYSEDEEVNEVGNNPEIRSMDMTAMPPNRTCIREENITPVPVPKIGVSAEQPVPQEMCARQVATDQVSAFLEASQSFGQYSRSIEKVFLATATTSEIERYKSAWLIKNEDQLSEMLGSLLQLDSKTLYPLLGKALVRRWRDGDAENVSKLLEIVVDYLTVKG